MQLYSLRGRDHDRCSCTFFWRSGEVRPTHRREPKPGRWWRTRQDPFAEVWPVLLSWLEEKPDLEAKEMLKRLQATGYGNFSDGQLRTLQRRVRVWRTRIARELVYGPNAAAEIKSGEYVAVNEMSLERSSTAGALT